MKELARKIVRLPQLQKTILEETEWKDYGYINEHDLIRRILDEALINLGLLDRLKPCRV